MQKSELENQKLFNNFEGLVLGEEELREVNGGVGSWIPIVIGLIAGFVTARILQKDDVEE